MKRKQDTGPAPSPEAGKPTGNSLARRTVLLAGAAAAVTAALPVPAFADQGRPVFKRVPVQYIAALADPRATAGSNAEQWGIWRKDPGPRGVMLDDYDRLRANGNIAPAQWKFDDNDWWLEEHGLIMEAPEFPMPTGRYLVTGNREKQAMLTIHPKDGNGNQHWELDNSATLYDVTHLRCRSARYTPGADAGSCTPARARQSDFPVTPGAEMPPVAGCSKQDYSVLIVYAVAEENGQS